VKTHSPEILVIRFSSLGDVILASAVLRGVATALPDARLTFATKLAYQPLFEHFDVLVNVVGFHPDESFHAYRRKLSGIRYDSIIDLHGSIRSVLLSTSLSARRRLHIKKHVAERRAMVRRKSGLDRPLSALRAYLEVLEPLGEGVKEQFPKLCLSPDELEQVASFRSEAPSCVGIGWGARWPTKIVPSQVWDAVLDRLGPNWSGKTRMFGLESDRLGIAAFVRERQTKQPNFDAQIECGRSLREVMMKLAACAVFVSSDSGLMHLAAALGVPSLGLFGPTHPSLGFAPVGPGARAFHGGTKCSPCHRHGAAPCFRERRFCFEDLNVDQIAESITDAITLESTAHPAGRPTGSPLHFPRVPKETDSRGASG
jgi:heptosyltransferase-2